jgi:dolichol kinase
MRFAPPSMRTRWGQVEWRRALFHFLATTTAMTVFYFSGVLVISFLLVVGMFLVVGDLARVYVPGAKSAVPIFLAKLVRDDERHQLAAMTHFVLAAMLILILHLSFGLPKDVAWPAMMFLSVGDPAARLTGTTFGTLRLFRTHKTLVGSLAFYLCGSLAAMLVCLIVGSNCSALEILVGGLCATFIELFTRRWDNFHILLWTSLLLWGLRALSP